MMSQIKHRNGWILTGNQNYTPAGILQLGQVLKDYSDFSTSVFSEGRIPNFRGSFDDESYLYGSSGLEHQTFKHWLEHADKYIRSQIDKDLQEEYTAMFENRTINTLQVKLFNPYERVAAHAVSCTGSLSWYKQPRRLWIVTGLQILGKGAKINGDVINQATGCAEANGDGRVAQVPVDAGLDIDRRDSDQYVYCYRLDEIFIEKSYLWRDWDATLKSFPPESRWKWIHKRK